MLNRSLRFRGAYRMLLLVPWAVPVFITALGWRYLYNVPNGFFDQLLRSSAVSTAPRGSATRPGQRWP